MRRNTTNNEDRWIEHYGDRYENRGEQQKEMNHEPFIVSTGNANFISNKGTPKLIALQDAIKGSAVQGLSELNTNYSMVPQQDQLSEKLRKVWRRRPKIKATWIREHKTNWTRNTAVQLGGNAIIATGEAAEYMHEAGEDSEGLARWTWMKFEGRTETKTAIIQVYRPIYNATGAGSVYQQQQSRIIDGKEVLAKFDEDLIDLIDEMMNEGFRIIVMGDFNMDVRNRRKKLIQNLRSRGIKERITRRYGEENAPNTYRWGKDPIDGIFATHEIEMIRGGYREGDPSLSDHRFVWAEFTYESILGKDRGKAFTPQTRRLQLQYKKVTKKFTQLLMKYMNEHKMLERAETLWKELEEHEMNEDRWNRYEALDKEFEQAAGYADNKCRRLFPYDIEFSPEVKEAISVLTIWKEIDKKIQRKQRIRGRYIRNMKKKYRTDHEFNIQCTRAECKKELDKAWEEFNRVRKEAPELRDSFIDQMIKDAEKIAGKEGKKKVKQLRNMKDNESKRQRFARVNAATGKFKSQGVRFIHKVNEEGEVTTITDPIEIEKEIIKANHAKLHQCNGNTPMRKQPLIDLLTKYDYDVWEQFLQGEIPIPEGLELGTKEYLEVYSGIEDNDFDILHTTESLKKSWRKAKEKTSSAPGPVHFGTMKTMEWCLPLAKFQTIMANIPLKTSKTPSNWRNDVEAMLMKKKDDFRPEKLRRIGLLNCAFNMNNKHIGRAAMKNAERLGMLAEEQFGSRKHLSAEKHALNKRLMLDIMRVTKTTGVLTANDAKSCYDRILHFATYAALRRVGVPKEAVISMVHTLRTMRHRVRTGYGDSILQYGGDEDDDQHGATQGNGAGPAIWALVSSPLLEILKKHGYGAKMVSPIKKEFFHMCGFAFVDDTDTIQMGEADTSTDELIKEAQGEMDLWECLIRSTGGAIEGDKSDFTVINWKWENGKAKYEKMDVDKHKLSCLNSEGERENLKQIPVTEARRTLGVWQSADGQENTQTEKMKQKAEDWGNKIMRSSLSKGDILSGLKTVLYPSLTYGLAATALTEKQCKEVFNPIRSKILPKLKICRTAPGTLIHGPMAYGGMEIKDLYTLQGIAHTKIMMEEGNKQSTTGRLLRNLIEQHAIETGMPGELTSWNIDEMGDIMTDTWVKSTLRFMRRDDIRMKTDMAKLHRWTEDDSFIMIDAIDAGIRGKRLQAINRCRVHLQATTKSDLSGGDGYEVTKDALDVKRGGSSMSSTTYLWPEQPRPNASDREEWRKTLEELYGVTPRYRRWSKPCGRWLQRADDAVNWLFVPEQDRLYKKNDEEEWQIWTSALSSRRRNGNYSRTTQVLRHRPHGGLPAITYSISENRVKMIGYNTVVRKRRRRDNNGRQPNSTLREELEHIDNSLKWAIEQLDLPEDDGRHIVEMIKNGKGRCMSDGSLKDDFGTSAFVFMTNEVQNGIGGRNCVPGMDIDQSSYRSELCGILGNIIVLNAICNLHEVTEGHTITAGCDNESAVWSAFGDSPVSTKMASFDIISAIRHQIKISPLKWKGKWVEGHQDGKTRKLDTWALANIECDNEAERMWNYKVRNGGELRPGVEGRMPGEGWVCLTLQGKISSEIDKQLYENSMRKEMIDFWERKERIDPHRDEEIDWIAHKKAMNNFGPRRMWIAKHSAGWAGSGKMMLKWKYRDNGKCPRCDEIEDTVHVVRCQSASNKEQFKKSMKPLKKWLEETTSPRIRSAVCTHMNAYQRSRHVNGFRTTDTLLKNVSSQQDNLGIRSFGEGFLVPAWKDVQEQYYGGQDCKAKSARWVAKLIQKIWEVSWDMWEARNYLIHNDTDVRDELFMNKVDVTLEVLLEEGKETEVLYPTERKFFDIPLEELRKKDEKHKVQWIVVAERYLDAQRLADRSTTSQGNFLQWLNTARTEQQEHQFLATEDNEEPIPTTHSSPILSQPRKSSPQSPVELLQTQIMWTTRGATNEMIHRKRNRQVAHQEKRCRRRLNVMRPDLKQQKLMWKQNRHNSTNNQIEQTDKDNSTEQLQQNKRDKGRPRRGRLDKKNNKRKLQQQQQPKGKMEESNADRRRSLRERLRVSDKYTTTQKNKKQKRAKRDTSMKDIDLPQENTLKRKCISQDNDNKQRKRSKLVQQKLCRPKRKISQITSETQPIHAQLVNKRRSLRERLGKRSRISHQNRAVFRSRPPDDPESHGVQSMPRRNSAHSAAIHRNDVGTPTTEKTINNRPLRGRSRKSIEQDGNSPSQEEQHINNRPLRGRSRVNSDQKHHL